MQRSLIVWGGSRIGWPLLAVLVLFSIGGCYRSDSPGGSTASAPPEPILETNALCELIDEAIDVTEARYMQADQQAAWQIVHGILAYGRNLQIYVDGTLVSALDYLLEGGRLEGWKLRHGERGLDTIVEPGSKSGQGHEDQWIGYLSLCDIPPDQTIKHGDRVYTIFDMVTQAQWDIREGMEATWTLMALAAYQPVDAEWTASDGQIWTVERVVRMEANEDLAESACGGTHRLTGLTVALNEYLAQGRPLTGGWKDAEEKIQWSIAKAREYQLPDGGFSSGFFFRPASTADVALQLNTTGHTLEFLTYALTDEQLAEPWVARAAQRVAQLLIQTRDLPVECGSLYHAARALQVYRLRIFGPRDFTQDNHLVNGLPEGADAVGDADDARDALEADAAPTAGGAGNDSEDVPAAASRPTTPGSTRAATRPDTAPTVSAAP